MVVNFGMSAIPDCPFIWFLFCIPEGTNAGQSYMDVAMIPVIGWIAAGIGIAAKKKEFEQKMEVRFWGSFRINA